MERDEVDQSSKSWWKKKRKNFDKFVFDFLNRICIFLSIVRFKRCSLRSVQDKPQGQEGLPESSEVASVLLVNYHIGVFKHWRFGDGTLQATRMVGRFSRSVLCRIWRFIIIKKKKRL